MAEEGRDCNSKSGAFCLRGKRAAGRAWLHKNTGSEKMPLSQHQLFEYLDSLGIAVKNVQHPPLHTVADSKLLRGEIPGGHTKNLFLKDRKDQYFLLTVDEDAIVDLKTIHLVIGAAGKVSFGRAEALLELLGVVPGAVTVFGAANDKEGKVKVFLDTGLMQNGIVNGHPLVNDATTSISAADLIMFLNATGHQPNILKLTA
jgi:Ala-tRNA(Pro) deacylase